MLLSHVLQPIIVNEHYKALTLAKRKAANIAECVINS